MRETDNGRKITVGIFIFIGIAILILGIFTLGGQKKTFVKSFSLNVIFEDIQGLKPGDNVWFSGVKVGTIKKIQFYGTSQVQVFMDLEVEAHKYIHKDGAASISSDGLIGNKIVVIDGGSTKFPFVEDGDRLRVNTTLSTDEIMKTLQVNNENLVDITGGLKVIIADLQQGKGVAGALLSDENAASNFKGMLADLKRTSEASNRIMADMNNFSRTLNTKNGLANQMFTDTVIFSKLQASVQSLQNTAKSASVLTENLNKASLNVENATSKLGKTDNPAGLLLNDKATAEQISRMIKKPGGEQ